MKDMHSQNRCCRPKVHRISLARFFFFLLTIYLLVDSVNGVLIRHDHFSISAPYKLLVMSLSVVIFRQYRIALACSLTVFFFVAVHFISGIPFDTVMAGMDWLIKFTMIPIFAFALKHYLLTRGQLGPLKIVFYAAFAILAVNVVLGSLGIGYATYVGAGGNVGTTGFIYAGNELALTFVIAGGVIMTWLITRKSYSLFFIFGCLMLALTAFTAVKFSILASAIMFFVFPLISVWIHRSGLAIPIRSLCFITFSIIISPLAISATLYWLLFESGLGDRLFFFLNEYDITTALLSGRDLRVFSALGIFVTEYSFFEKLFGTGLLWLEHPGVMAQVEIDLFDFLMRYGLVGALLTYGFLVYALVKIVAQTRGNPDNFYYLIIFLLVLLGSLTAGHVLYAGTAAPLLGALLALAMSKPVHK